MFIYRNRPMQLGYFDGVGIQPLPFWIANHNDLAVAVASIRERRWGSIASVDFWVGTYTNYSVGTADGETLQWNHLYGASGDLPIASPAYQLMKNNLLS